MTTPQTNGYKPTFKAYTIDELDLIPEEYGPWYEPDEVAWEHYHQTGSFPDWYDSSKCDPECREMMAPEGGDVRFAFMSEHDFPGFGKARITHIPDGATFPAVGCELTRWVKQETGWPCGLVLNAEQTWRLVSVNGAGFDVEHVGPFPHWMKPLSDENISGTEKMQGHTEVARLRVVHSDVVKQKQVEWIWRNQLARGKSALIGGDPGEGKSQVGCDIIARITRESPWPDGSGNAPRGSCIILSAEDAADDTICPRLTAAGADLSKVKIVEAAKNADGSERALSLLTDLDALGELITDIGDVVLLMVDPVTAYLGADLDSHRTTSVRSVLQPLEKFATKHGIAILGITHPPKAAQSKAINAFTGSLAFIAAARTGFIVVAEPETERKLLLAVKSNIGPMSPGLGYVIEQAVTVDGIETSRVHWDGLPVETTANEAVQASNQRERGGSRSDAEEFLRGYLENGPMPANQVKAAAAEMGISEKTLWRANEQIGIVAEKVSYKDGWRWRLPETWRPAGWNGG